MSELTDKQIDKIIKNSMQEDTKISDKANSVFDSFLNADNLNKIAKENNLFAQAKVESSNAKANEKLNNTASKKNAEKVMDKASKVVEIAWYTRLNKVLGVAAVSLGVLLVGGAALYYYNPKQNNSNSNTVVVERKYMVKNEELQIENEKVTKVAENKYVKATLIGNTDIAVQFKSEYWDQYDDDFSSDKFYKVENINQNVKDIFIGEIGNCGGTAYIFVLLEDGAAQYINIYGQYNAEIYYYAQDIQGLYDVVGFEQGKRKFFHSETEYGYVNAIKSDGTTKEIDLNNYNSWEDKSTKEFDRLNQKYIDAYNGKAIMNDRSGDFEVDNASYLEENGQYYCYKDNNLYKVTDSGLDCLAQDIGGFVRSGKLTFHVNERTVIYKLDENIIFEKNDGTIVNEISNIEKDEIKWVDVDNDGVDCVQINTHTKGGMSEFDIMAKESGDYEIDDMGFYYIYSNSDRTVAYTCQDTCIFSLNNKTGQRMLVAQGVDKFYKDSNGKLVGQLLHGFGNVVLSDYNISLKDFDVTDAETTCEYGNENILIYTKNDGTISFKINEGGLAGLGINNTDTIYKENVEYNLCADCSFTSFCDGQSSKADSVVAIFDDSKEINRLMFAYTNKYNYLVCFDIVEMIKSNNSRSIQTEFTTFEGTARSIGCSVMNFENSSKPEYTYYVESKLNNGEIKYFYLKTPYEIYE